MRREQIPLAQKHVWLIGTLVTAPVFAGAAIVFTAEGDGQLGAALAAFAVLIAVLICGAMLARRSIVLSGEVLTIRSSFYTVSIRRDAVDSVNLSTVLSSNELGVTLKRNGVAACGLLSGRFYAGRGEKMFCAVSTYPVSRLTFVGHATCSAVAVSRTDAVEDLIRQWRSA